MFWWHLSRLSRLLQTLVASLLKLPPRIQILSMCLWLINRIYNWLLTVSPQLLMFCSCRFSQQSKPRMKAIFFCSIYRYSLYLTFLSVCFWWSGIVSKNISYGAAIKKLLWHVGLQTNNLSFPQETCNRSNLLIATTCMRTANKEKATRDVMAQRLYDPRLSYC